MKKKLHVIQFGIMGVIAAVLLSGCKANVITKIIGDGSGTFSQEVGFSVEEMTALNSFGSSSDFCKNLGGSNSLSAASVTQELRGTETWCVFETPFATLDELKSLYYNSDTSVSDLSIINGQLHYNVTINLTGANATAELLQTKWILVMPGKIMNHNADEIKGSTLTWNLSLGHETNLFAESTTKGGLPPTWIIVLVIALLCLCLVVLIIIALVVFLVIRNNQRKQTPGASPVASQ